MFPDKSLGRSIIIVLLIALIWGAFNVSCGDDDDDDNDNNDTSQEPQDDDATPDDDDVADDDVVDDDTVDDDDLIDDDNDVVDDDDNDDAVEETEVEVPADQSDPVDSGVEVQTDQEFTIKATDSITLGPGGDPIGPEGNGEMCGMDCAVPTAPRGSLLARVGDFKAPGDWFLVGSTFAGNAPRAGVLELLINDDDYTDNSGGFTVTIAINTLSIAPTADDENGVFVSKDAGNDADDCSAAAPCATISRGIAQAGSLGKSHVFIAVSATPPYIEADDIQTDVSLYGGYVYDGVETWTRGAQTSQTEIANTISVTGSTGSAEEVTVTLEGLLINETGAKGDKAFSSAVEISQQAHVTIVHCKLVGGTEDNNSYAVYVKGGRFTIVDTGLMGVNGGIYMRSLTDQSIPAVGTLLNSQINEPEKGAKADFAGILMSDDSSLTAQNNVIHVKSGNDALRLRSQNLPDSPSLSLVNNLVDGAVILAGNSQVTILANSYIRGIEVADVSSLVIESNAQIDVLDERSSCIYVQDLIDYLRYNNFWSVSPTYHLLEFTGVAPLYTDFPDINDCAQWQSPGFCSVTGGNTNDEVTLK